MKIVLSEADEDGALDGAPSPMEMELMRQRWGLCDGDEACAKLEQLKLC